MLDAIIVLLLALSAFGGFRSGAIMETASIAGFFAGLTVASLYWAPAAALANRWIISDTAAAVLAFVVLFAFGYAIVMVVASVIRGLVHLILLGWLDRLLGAVIGLLRGIFILELATLLLRLPGAPVSWVRESTLLPILETYQATLFHSVFDPFTQRVPLLGTFYKG